VLRIKLLSSGAVLPRYQSPGASGFDLHASENVTIAPGETRLVPTGLAIEIEPGRLHSNGLLNYELQIRPRSGLSAKTKLRVILGTCDGDYRGEIKIIAENTGDVPYFIQSGDRIAQAVVAPVVQMQIEQVNELSDTARGAGGFGSTNEQK
jgi:dUTP pyrophosphatase